MQTEDITVKKKMKGSRDNNERRRLKEMWKFRIKKLKQLENIQ